MLNKAIIDLSLLKENVLNIKSKLNKKVKLNAVVKADAYGHGAEIIASSIYPYVDSYSVALLEEGIALRQVGIDKEILLLIEPFENEIDRAVKYGMTFCVQNAKIVKEIAKASLKEGVISKIHIAVNTGMNREGVDSERELHLLIQAVLKEKGVKLTGIYSHLACPEEKVQLKKQVGKFLLAIKCARGYNNIVSHLSASGGYLQNLHFDMVRIGILLYGYKPFKSDYVNVTPIMKVYAPTIKTKNIKENSLFLYGEKVLGVKKTSTLIRYGYADGLPRQKGLDLTTNRCMDVSGINGKFNGYYPVLDGNADVIAKEYGTISYEVLVNASKRAEMIYKDE